MDWERKAGKLNEIKGVSIKPRRGGYRVVLGKSITRDKVVEKHFKELKDAVQHVEDWVEVKNQATSAARVLSDSKMEDALAAFRYLEKNSVDLSLLEICRDYVAKLPQSSSRTYNSLIRAYLDYAERSGRADTYIKNLKTYFGSFAKLYGDKLLHQVDRDDVEEWLGISCYGKSAKTYNNYLVSVKALYEFAVGKEWLTATPLSNLQKLKVIPKEPCIFGVSDLQAVLAYCLLHKLHKELLFIGIQAFAGIRRSEVLQLKWGSVGEDSIRVIGASSKINKGRGVPILPPLRSVLKRYEQWCNDDFKDEYVLGISPDSWDDRKNMIRDALGISWGHNQLRHSFVSYRLAATSDVAKTAYESGHTPTVLQSNYDAVVVASDAIKYFNIAL